MLSVDVLQVQACKHFGALCYLIEESCRLKLTTTYEPQSSSDSLQTWHHPRQIRKLDCFHPMDSIKFIKNEHGKTKGIHHQATILVLLNINKPPPTTSNHFKII